MIFGRMRACFLALFVTLFLVCPFAEAAPGDQPKKILFIFSYNFDYPGIALARKGFSAVFAEHTHLGLPYSLEEFQLSDGGDNEYFRATAAALKVKYAGGKPDLVVAGYKQAINFMVRYGHEVFGDTPVVVMGMDIEDYSNIEMPANYFGAIATRVAQNNIEMILQNHPALKKIYVIAGATPAERDMAAATLRLGAVYKDRVAIVAPEQVPYYHMLARLNATQENVAILYLTMQEDRDRRILAPTMVARDIRLAAKMPVYGIMDAYSGSGITGGFLIDHEILGRRVADVSLSILDGNPLARIPVATEPIGAYWFDWRELQRWGIDERWLPENSKIEFQEFSVWNVYKWQIMGGFFVVILQGFLIVGLLVNRSMRRKAQEQLLAEREFRGKTEKMASIGMLAAGIAHEINQPLNAIKLLSSGLVFGYKQGKERETADLVDNLEKISWQTSRVADIIEHLRALIQRDDTRLRPCEINAAVRRALDLVGQQLKDHGISVDTRLEPELPAVTGVETALEEVMINLLMNSMQALDLVDKHDKRIEIRTWYNEGVTLEVSDNGPGVKPELESKIFEPFVSTKTTADSLGLGLTISSNIVTMCGGTIEQKSGDGGGARFIVKFPNRK